MKKIFILALVVMVALAMSAPVFAVGPGKSLEFAGGSAGKVTFSGDTHKVNKCNECHPGVFKMKKGTAKITKADHPKYCGSCHNGTKAFAQDEANCGKCHKK